MLFVFFFFVFLFSFGGGEVWVSLLWDMCVCVWRACCFLVWAFVFVCLLNGRSGLRLSMRIPRRSPSCKAKTGICTQGGFPNRTRKGSQEKKAHKQTQTHSSQNSQRLVCRHWMLRLRDAIFCEPLGRAVPLRSPSQSVADLWVGGQRKLVRRRFNELERQILKGPHFRNPHAKTTRHYR